MNNKNSVKTVVAVAIGAALFSLKNAGEEPHDLS